MNARGAERGGRMIGAYIGMWPNDHGFGMADADTAGPAADLIADVLHAAVSLGLDVDDVLRLARAHFDSEVRVDDSRRYLEGDTLDPACTGYVDESGFAHDGERCPIHEREVTA